MFRILVNSAITRAKREDRTVPVSALGQFGDSAEPAELEHLTVDGMWADPPQPWCQTPEERVLRIEIREQIEAAIARLPPRQRVVVTLRDLQGRSPGDVCGVLDVTDAAHRVLLHRARVKVRDSLVAYFRD